MVSGDTLAPAGKPGANTLPMPNFIRRQDSGMLWAITVSCPESASAAAARNLVRPEPAAPVTMTPELPEPESASTAARSSASRMTRGKDEFPAQTSMVASIPLPRSVKFRTAPKPPAGISKSYAT